MERPHVRSHRVFRRQEEPALFGPSLHELVPEDHEVWSLKSVVDSLFAQEFRESCTDCGGIPYDPAALLAVVMYGFMKGIHATRALESSCRYDVRFWALTGRNHPDHNTIHRFMVGMREKLPSMMARVASHAKELGMMPLKVVSVDGTKVAANVSQWTRLVNAASDEDESPRRQKHPLTGYLTGFNAQVAVDAGSGMVVGEALLQDGNDMHAMPAVLESIQATAGQMPGVVVADKGYDSGETHTLLAEREVLGVVLPQARDALFWELNESGDPICPKGHAPQKKGGYTRRGKRWVRLTVRQCQGCDLKDSCGVKGQKTLYVPEGTRAADRILNAKRLETEEVRALARTRGPTVELVFARMKLRYRLRRLSYKERSKAHAEFRTFCLAENLRILLRTLLGLFLAPREASNRQQAHTIAIQTSPVLLAA